MIFVLIKSEHRTEHDKQLRFVTLVLGLKRLLDYILWDTAVEVGE